MRVTIKRVSLSYVLVCCALLSGCATILTRVDYGVNDKSPYGHPYPATYLDVMVLATGRGVQGAESPIFRVLAFVDLPFSVAIDSILLPMDLCFWIFNDPPEETDGETK